MRTYNITIHLKGNALRQLDKMFNRLQKTNREAGKLGDNFSRAGGKIQAVAQAGLGALRFGAKLHAISYLAGPMMLKKGADFLLSPQMNEGIRYLQRMNQARIGLGPEFAEAQKRALALAAGFGLDPSTVVSSMNVLTGMRVGAKNVTLEQAERITQFGGLIAQQSGIPADTVMLNLQQIMTMAVPNLRDIKQLLTHAPILGRYAMEEMQKRGITGKKTADFLQEDKGFLLASIERFLSENPALAATKARGIVSMANLEFFAKLAENPSWLRVAQLYQGVLSEVGNALSNFITNVANSVGFRESIERFKTLINKLASADFAKALNRVLEWIHDVTGIGLTSEEEQQAAYTAHADEAIRRHIRENLAVYKDIYSQKGWTIPEGNSIYSAREAFVSDVLARLASTGKGVGEFVSPWVTYEMTPEIISEYRKSAGKLGMGNELVTATAIKNWTDKSVKAKLDEIGYSTDLPGWSSIYLTNDWTAGYAALLPQGPAIQEALHSIAKGKQSMPLTDFSTGAMGDAISGFGQDRRALVINFNAPIVEWDSTIEANNPQEVVDTVSDTIEGAASRAIQIALLGATGTMSSRF